MLVEFVS